MGVMEKMRASTKYILWLLIISFGLLWGLSDTKVFNAIMSGPRDLGSVNGSPISIEAYNNLVNNYLQRAGNQSNGSSAEMQAYYEDLAWNQLVLNQILKDKMKDLGISVTDAEIVDMVTGKNPDPLIAQQFRKKDGTIDRVALQAAINAPENTKAWIQIEHQLREKRRREKLGNYIQSALQISNLEIEQQWERQNSSADFNFVRVPYATIPDSTIQVTDSELRDYYDRHKEEFHRDKTWNFEYVTFSKAPTHKDTVRTINEVKKLRDDFKAAKNDSTFLADNQSATPYTGSWVKKSEVRKPYDIVFDMKKGEVSDVITLDGRVHMIKKLGERTVKGHKEVLFADMSEDITADPLDTVDKVASNADDFNYYATQTSFQDEAKKENLQVHQSIATQGTPFIAGIGQSQQMLNALERSEEGKISKAIELPDQFVVFKVTGIKPEGIRSFDEVKDQLAPSERAELRQKKLMQKVSDLMKQNTTLDALAKAQNTKVYTAENTLFSGQFIPNGGREPKIIGDVFDAKLNQVRGPLAGESAVFVIEVTRRTVADSSKITSNDRQQIRQQLEQQKQRIFGQTWIDQLKKNAEIVDNRAQLLR